MIREVGASIGRVVLDGIGRVASRLQETRALSADLLESDDAYLAIFDAPGATADDVGVRFESNTVSVRIDRFREFYDGYEMVFPGRGLTLYGDIELPEGADAEADQADATLTQIGTLEVLIPKSEGEATDGETAPETDIDTSAVSDTGEDSDTSDTR